MCLPLGSSVKSRAFTLVEALASTLIIGVVMAALSVALTIGETSRSISTAQVDLQANVRGVLDIVVRDFRQTVTQQIVNSEPVPSTTYAKFRPVQRWNITNANYELDANFTEYNYSAANTTLTRNILNSVGVVLSSRNFYNITAIPFYTVDTSDESVVPLTKDGLQASNGRVVIVIAGQGLARQGRILSYNLTEEVKVRNE
ncbi:MAG: prepilin-type N-terminal cleavage/methylation domain-containing protein [Candidatus Omnitrophota bacterium]